jgi:branched-chain amino acid transport system permease protein
VRTAVQAIISGIAEGSLLALLTFGLVLVYKATNVLNLAHGQIATLAAFIAAIYLTPNDLPVLLVLVVMVMIGAAVGLLTEQAIIRPLRQASLWTVVLATLATGLVIQALTGVLWGYDEHFFPYAVGTGVLRLGDYVITRQQLLIVAVTAALVVASTWFFRRTRTGVAMRAMAGNRMGAEIVGTRTRLLQSSTWMIGGALAGLTGFLAAPAQFVAPGMMETYILDALAAATLAGLGSLPGAVLGALVIGIASQFASLYVPSEFRDLLPLAVITLALLARPQGITRSQAERAV